MSCASCVRVFMMIFNFLFAVIGFGMLSVGLYFFFVDKNFSPPNDFVISEIDKFLLIIAGIGLITFVLGILGCCGAFHYSRCILGFFFILLLILFAAEITVGVFGFLRKDDVNKHVGKFLQESLNDDKKTAFKGVIEYIFDCCAYKSLCEAVPPKCSGKIDVISKNVFIMFGSLIGLALIQLTSLVFASILCCAAKDRVEYSQYTPVYQ